MPTGGGRSYAPILTGAANCVDAEVMYSGGEALLILNQVKEDQQSAPSLSAKTKDRHTLLGAAAATS